MGTRRLVLNGLTAECAGAGGDERDAPPGEHYHELELYRQLLALPPPTPPTPSPPVTRPPGSAPEEPQRSECGSPAPRAAPDVAHTASAMHHKPRTRSPLAQTYKCANITPAGRNKYLGSFPVGGADGAGGEDEASRAALVSQQIRDMKGSGRGEAVLLRVNHSAVSICRPHDQSVHMSHALRRISYAACDSSRGLFALVARGPRSCDAGTDSTHGAALTYCHAFATDTPLEAEQLHALVGDAFRMALARQLQPSAPLWGGAGEERTVRAPDSLPLTRVHFPRNLNCADRSPPRCEISPSSSEGSPPDLVRYRRLGERAPLVRRLRRRRHAHSDDDDAPLVTDTPTTPTNPLCVNEGYVNEAVSDAETRTRVSNCESPAPPPRLHSARDHMHNDIDLELRKQKLSNKTGCKSATCSRATSSSSAASSCSSGNNNPRPHDQASHTSHASQTSHDSHDPLEGSDEELEPFEDLEPALRYASWFQAGIPREIALEVLTQQCVGSFLVRASSRGGRRLALSLRVPPAHAAAGDVAHYLILRQHDRYRIKGFTKEFPSLLALITHHSVMPELLPCPLRLERDVRPRPRDLDYTAQDDFQQLITKLDIK